MGTLDEQLVDEVLRRGYPDSAETGQDFKLITEDPGRQNALDRITQQAGLSRAEVERIAQDIRDLDPSVQVKPRFRRWRKRR